METIYFHNDFYIAERDEKNNLIKIIDARPGKNNKIIKTIKDRFPKGPAQAMIHIVKKIPELKQKGKEITSSIHDDLNKISSLLSKYDNNFSREIEAINKIIGRW